MDKTSLLYWYPIIKGLSIPMPKTTWVEIPFEVFCDYIDAVETASPTVRPKIEDYTQDIKVKAKKIGYPLFLRTDLASGKHSWDKSCYVEKEEDLFKHIWEVVEFNFTADIFGLECNALVFREYIPMASQFTAFWGNLPINPERRYFIRDGKVECHHPYWTADAIEGPHLPEPSKSDWKELLDQMDEESDREIDLLTMYSGLVAKLLPGYWSVDFCKARNGEWILIDLAEGRKSWHPECPFKEV